MRALTKKQGVVRPIVVRCTYRRLANKLATKYGSVLVSESLRPIQLGVGTPGGCGALVDAARKFSGSTTANPPNICSCIYQVFRLQVCIGWMVWW